jgi:hypothetical protein
MLLFGFFGGLEPLWCGASPGGVPGPTHSVCHQIVTRWSSGSHSASDSVTPKAS